MTHLLNTSALLAHYLAEPGAERVQALFEVTVQVVGRASRLPLRASRPRCQNRGRDARPII